MTKKAAKKKASKKKAAKKKASRYAGLKKKVAGKASQKSKSRKRGDGNELVSDTPVSGSREIERAALEADVRQWTRLWAQAGWDAIEATAKMHPELKPSEIQRIASQYRNSPHLKDSLMQVLREISDRLEINSDDAAEILSQQATTSVIDFFGDDGRMKSVREMRRMPRAKQLALKKLKVTETANYDKDGNLLSEKTVTEVEAYDIQQAIERLARLRQWGFSEGERDIAEMLAKAERRLQHHEETEPIDISDFEVQED